MSNDLRTEKEILNGKYILITELNEFRMSLWVNGFGIRDYKTLETIIQLNSAFNLDNFTELENTIEIVFRIYPNGSRVYNVEINPLEKWFNYLGKTYSLKEFNQDFFETDSL